MVGLSVGGLFVALRGALWLLSRRTSDNDLGWFAGFLALRILTIVTALVWVFAVRALLPFASIDAAWHSLAFWLSALVLLIALVAPAVGGERLIRAASEQGQGLRRLSQLAIALGVVLAVGCLILYLTRLPSV